MRLAWATSDDLPATTMRASANYLRTRFIAAALGFLETGRRRSAPLCLECRPLAPSGRGATSDLSLLLSYKPTCRWLRAEISRKKLSRLLGVARDWWCSGIRLSARPN